MSPKKGVRSITRSTEKLRSVRKEKPHMPTNFKVSIPLPGSEREGVHVPIVKGRRPPLYTKHLDIKTKVELANSVARQQLVKEEPSVFQVDNVVIIKAPVKPRQRRGRKKNDEIVSDFFLNRIITESNTAEVAPLGTISPKKHTPAKKPTPPNKQIPPRKILTRKRLAESKANEDAKCAKIEPTSTEMLGATIKLENDAQDVDLPVEPISPEPQPAVQPSPEVVQPTPIVEPSEHKVVQPQPKKTKPTVKRLQPAARKPPPIRQAAPSKKRGPRGKQQNTQPYMQTPSVVDLLKKQVADAEGKPKPTPPNPPGLVESRKDSVGSNSNKSWTRDISSSSNTTCIGSVCSNDFVRINKKLPVLKLTNIDSEVKKRQIEALEAASAVVEETEEDLSDSYDSDSSDSREGKLSEQYNDSLGANSLHLSASSSSQFTNTRRKENTYHYAKESSSDYPKDSPSDYDKAANKLSQTMEKIDLEIIQWMSSDNEDVGENFVKFRDKMFDILDREFGVITHCRHLKEMLNPRKKDNIDEACTPERIQDRVAKTNSTIAEQTAPVEETPVKVNVPLKENIPVKEITPAKENTPTKENTPIETNNKELEKEFVEPRKRPSRQLSSNSEGNVSNASTRASKDATSDDEAAAGSSNNPYYDHHDDDDTLSLFAESISGFESSRMNTSISSAVVSKPPPVEEYIPKPVKVVYQPNTEKQTYCPTKIREDAQIAASKVITVCEKQNADSTSIYKQSNSTDDTESFQDFTEDIFLDTRLVGAPDMIKKPRLMDSYFEGLPKTRSLVFGQLCFYNLMNCCRNYFTGQCRFMHLIPTSAQIKEKLILLDERLLIQEYLLLRKWTELRRRYGMCYVDECAKRGLTRILVEMAYDFIVKARNESEEDTRLRVYTIEATLLHLNTVDLSICEDLLKLTIHSDQANRTLLCDVFMATMSITQNFSRFKVVFLNLTYFMVDNDRTFNKDVVEHILERVCILPFEEPVARALIQMMRLTKADIFYNSMIGHFEKQISANKAVFEEYSLLKSQCALSSLLASSLAAEAAAEPEPQPQPQPHPQPQPPAASPDTTNLDSMNKATNEPSKPVITRTIGMNPPIVFNRTATSPGASSAFISPTKSSFNPGPSRPHVNNTGSDSSDDSTNIRTWRNRSIFPHLQPPPMANLGAMHGPTLGTSTRGTPTRGNPTRGTPRGAMRPPMWSHMRAPPRPPYNQRLVTFKSPSNYMTRQPGPNY